MIGQHPHKRTPVAVGQRPQQEDAGRSWPTSEKTPANPDRWHPGPVAVARRTGGSRAGATPDGRQPDPGVALRAACRPRPAGTAIPPASAVATNIRRVPVRCLRRDLGGLWLLRGSVGASRRGRVQGSGQQPGAVGSWQAVVAPWAQVAKVASRAAGSSRVRSDLGRLWLLRGRSSPRSRSTGR